MNKICPNCRYYRTDLHAWCFHPQTAEVGEFKMTTGRQDVSRRTVTPAREICNGEYFQPNWCIRLVSRLGLR